MRLDFASGILRYSSTPRSRHQAIQPVECGVLIALCERGIVEDRIDEVVNAATQCQHRLTNMDEFDGVLSDNVNAEQFAGLTVKQQLHKTDRIADDLSTRQFAIRSLASLVRNFLFGQFLFVAANE